MTCASLSPQAIYPHTTIWSNSTISAPACPSPVTCLHVYHMLPYPSTWWCSTLVCAPAVSQGQHLASQNRPFFLFCTFSVTQIVTWKNIYTNSCACQVPAMPGGDEFSCSCVCHDPAPHYSGTGIFYHVCHVPITSPGDACTPVYMPSMGQHYNPASAGTCLHLCCVQVLLVGGTGM